ncbi:MAG: YbaB/EbfC family nucleoid-associated protein, partial [Planctomycetota bacterium]
IEADAGGGMVKVEVNGVGEVIKVTIEPSLVEKNETEMIEDLMAAAMNHASAKAKQRHAEVMQSLTEGINLPGLSDAISKFTGTEPNAEN